MLKYKHSNPPNLIGRLPVWARISRSPVFTNIENFHHKNFFLAKLQRTIRKHFLHSRSLSSLQSYSMFTHVFLPDAKSRPGTNVITSSLGLLATPFPGLKLSVELCSKSACHLFQCSKKLFQWITSSVSIILSISSVISLHYKSLFPILIFI